MMNGASIPVAASFLPNESPSSHLCHNFRYRMAESIRVQRLVHIMRHN
jgi:hypothetical protein